MESLGIIPRYLGVLGYPLLALSVLTTALVILVVIRKARSQEVSEWVEILLCHFREFAVLLGLMGTIYGIMHAFVIDGLGTKEVQERMFSILSTGLWSTFYGCIVAIIASIGLIVLKRV
ncbi:MAG: MotA/TolQ/ExbB proton channel family protein [Desulfovermiculus sp.]